MSGYSFGQKYYNLRITHRGTRLGVVHSFKRVLPCIYDQIEIFKDGYIVATLNDKIHLYDSNGNKISKQEFSSIGPFRNYPEYLYSNGVCKVCLDRFERCGLIDTAGNVILPLKYKHIGTFHENIAEIRLGEKNGFVNTNGQIITPIIYTNTTDFKQGFARVELNGKEGVIDSTGKIIIPIEYTPDSYDYNNTFHYGRIAINKAEKWGFADIKGQEIIPLEYDFVWGFRDSLAAVKQNEKWGFINLTGEIMIPIEYDGPLSPEFHEGFTAVQLGEKLAFINKSNQPITEFKYYNKLCHLSHYKDLFLDYQFRDGLAIVEDANCKYGVIDTNGKEIVPVEYDAIQISYYGKISAWKDGKVTIYQK